MSIHCKILPQLIYIGYIYTVGGYLGCLQFLQYDQNFYKHCLTYS